MAVVFDRVARTYFRTGDSPRVVIRQHVRDLTAPRRRERMRQGARQILTVIAKASSCVTFDQIKSGLPEVSIEALHSTLSRLCARGDVDRFGVKCSYRYSLPADTTFATT